MKEMVKFVSKYQNLFDDNALDDRLQNGLHILCSQRDPDLEMFDAVLALRDIDLNQMRLDGKTPHQVLSDNLVISVDKRSEMLKKIASQKEFKQNIKFKKVLIVGTENSGRRSLLTHLRIQHGQKAYSQWETSVQKSKIHKFIILTMQKLIDECVDFRIMGNSDAKQVKSIKLGYMERLKRKTFLCLQELWKLDGIKNAAAKLNSSSSVFYCFDERLDEIMQRSYYPNEQDLIRLLDESVSIVTTEDEESQCNINWIGHSSAEKVLKASPLYDNIDCVIFMVSLIAFMEEMDPYNTENNALIESLNLFKQYCEDKRFEKSKFVILFNKTDIFKQRVMDQHESLQQLVCSDNNEQIIDNSDYRQLQILIQSMFRAQHPNRIIFSYPISAAHPSTVRPIIKEIEDIVLEPNIPTISHMELSKDDMLSGVKWIATLQDGINESNNMHEYALDIRSISSDELEKIDKEFTIDLDCMLFEDGKKINYLIKDDKYRQTVWAKWQKDKIAFYTRASGFWQIMADEQEDVIDLNAIFGILHHKVLRIQFDGATMNKNPIKIKFLRGDKVEQYEVSWWNMARIGHCNALIINGSFYLNVEKISNENSRNPVRWSWYDNTQGDLLEYDVTVLDQLECSYQANLSNNFPREIVENITNHDPRNYIFNDCILTDLMKYFQENHNNHSKFVLRFEYTDEMKMDSVTQLSIKSRDNKFSRHVQRKVNGRNPLSSL